MTDVQFEEEAPVVRRVIAAPMPRSTAGIADLLVRKGIVRTASQAKALMVGGALLALLAAAIVFVSFGRSPGDRYGNLKQLQAENPEWFGQ
jgi:hypothetical protein